MSLRSIQRLTMMSLLVLGSVGVAACGDDDNDDGDKDAGDNGGTNNNGSSNDGTTGGDDAGVDAGPGPLMCGEETKECKSGVAAGIPLPACCTEEDEACGITIPIPGIKDVFPGCQPQNAPESSSDHAFCDGVIAQVNGTTGIPAAMGVNIKLKGCCTMEGFCGADANDIDLVNASGEPTSSLSLQLGCVSLAKFIPAGTPLPFDPATVPCSVTLPDGG